MGQNVQPIAALRLTAAITGGAAGLTDLSTVSAARSLERPSDGPAAL